MLLHLKRSQSPSQAVIAIAVQNDYEKPLAHVHFRAEGDMEFRTLLYIPERAPPNFLNDYYGNKAQLKLYVRRVFISDDFEELIPRHAPHVPSPLTTLRLHLLLPHRLACHVQHASA